MSSSTQLLRLDNIIVTLDAEANDPNALRDAVARYLHIKPDVLLDVAPLKRSIDSRGQPRLVYSVHATVPARQQWPKAVREGTLSNPYPLRHAPKHQRDTRVVVIGAGPAGLFATHALARAGLRPILLEQGKPVESRARDVSRLMHWGQLQRHSNLCYGEGGAGTWSDGKLTTRIGAPQVRHVLETLVEMGGPERILLDGKPHLGTDRLIAILKGFRAHLIDMGADLRFGHRVQNFCITNGRLTGVTLSDGTKIDAEAVVLATGHSSEMLYRRLHELGVALKPKAFAVGFRVEHPQALINSLQYGRHAENPMLPAADYRLTANLKVSGHDRGVYSFCMCPGGQVVPTPTDPDGVVVNGMSHAARSGRWANSALVVTVNPNDFGSSDILAGVAFQRRAERIAGAMGGGLFAAPAQTVTGFLAHKVDSDLRKTSYTPGVTPADLSRCYPDFVTESLRTAIARWGGRKKEFLAKEALLIGVETRTSAPVQITRGGNLQSISTPNLYPCGEGAGYGGGIVSAAVDGLRVADAILDRLGA